MSKNRYGPYSFGIFGLLLLSTTSLAFAEVTDIQLNSESFNPGDTIKFSGTVEKGSTGLVTIVIRDFNDEFVLLEQATINPDDSFEKTVNIDDAFTDSGIYGATGFILNMTKGVTMNFGISFNGIMPNLNEEENKSQIIEPLTSTKTIDVKANVNDVQPQSKIASFVDLGKPTQYYLDRYYNEISYKSWFDRNYPGLTIEEVVGYSHNAEKTEVTAKDIIDNEIIPEAQALPVTQSLVTTQSKQPNSNLEIAEVSLAIAALGILFGAVYGIKRKVDDNSKQISINRNFLKKKFIPFFIGSNLKTIIQTRLAKGEITLEEYEKLKLKLN